MRFILNYHGRIVETELREDGRFIGVDDGSVYGSFIEGVTLVSVKDDEPAPALNSRKDVMRIWLDGKRIPYHEKDGVKVLKELIKNNR